MEYSKSFRMTESQAAIEASRCLHCYEAPCQKSCPAGIDVPQFIRRIATGDIRGAANTIRSSNPLGMICGEICPAQTLCMKECNCGRSGEPIAISALQAYAMEISLKNNGTGAAQTDATKRSRIAIVGGGPSGVSAASLLKMLGYAVTLFEKSARLGGVPMEEIPNERLNKALYQTEIESLLQNGVEIRKNTPVDAELALKISNEYDAIYLACGLGDSNAGVVSTATGVYDAEQFLRLANEGAFKKRGIDGSVFVQGGGNTAIDAAVTAKRLGAERVYVCYRRSQKEMPAWREEFASAVAEGVEFLFQTQVLNVELKDDEVKGVLLAPVELGAPGADGRRKPIVRHEKQYVLAGDMLINATGKEPNQRMKDAFAQAAKAGKLFVGGDIANGGATVVQAVAEAKRAVSAIDAYLSTRN